MLEALLAAAEEAARCGGEVLRSYFRDPRLDPRSKARNDFVTQADEESEAVVVERLLARFPDHAILAEEGGSRGESEYEWVIDPLDGTSNFIQGLPIYAVSIACRKDDELLAAVVYEPETDNLFTATRGGGTHWNGRPAQVSNRRSLDGAVVATGFPFRAHELLDVYLELFRGVFCQARSIRRCGAAALDLAYTSVGIFDGMFEFALAPWDVAAGTLLIREADGIVTDPEGAPEVSRHGHIIAGTPGVHQDLRETIDQLPSDQSLSSRLASLSA